MRTRAVELRQRRRTLGLTQEQLAAEASLDVKTVRKAEKPGERVDLRVIVAIAEQFSLSPQDLIEPEETACPPPERLIELVKKWGEYSITGEIDKWLAMHTTDTIFELPEKGGLPVARDCRGIDELDTFIREAAQILRIHSTDPATEQYHATGNLVFMRVTAQMEFLPARARFEARHVNEFEFEGELIKRRTTIADYHPLRKILDEMGFDPTKPNLEV